MAHKKVHLPDLYQDADRNNFKPKFQGDHERERLAIFRVFVEVLSYCFSGRTSRTGFFLVQDIQDLSDPVAALKRIRDHIQAVQTQTYECDVRILESSLARAKVRRRAWVPAATDYVERIQDAQSPTRRALNDGRLFDWYYHFTIVRWNMFVVQSWIHNDPSPRQVPLLPERGGAEVLEKMQGWAFQELCLLEKIVFESSHP